MLVNRGKRSPPPCNKPKLFFEERVAQGNNAAVSQGMLLWSVLGLPAPGFGTVPEGVELGLEVLS